MLLTPAHTALADAAMPGAYARKFAWYSRATSLVAGSGGPRTNPQQTR